MPLTDAEELELLELERQRGLELDKQMSTAKPKPQFSTIQEAAAAMQQVRQGQQIAASNVNNLDPLISLGRSAYNLSWPVSAIANKFMNNGSPVPEATTSGGRLMQDASAFANPLVGRAVGYGVEQAGKVVIPAAGAVIGGAKVAVSKLRNFIKKNNSLPSSDKLSKAIDSLRTQSQTIKTNLSDTNTQNFLTKQELNQSLKATENQYKATTKSLQKGFEQTKIDLEKQLGTKIGETAKSVKEPVSTLFRNAGKAYATNLDDILSKIESNAPGIINDKVSPITNESISNTFNNLIQRFQADPLIVKSSGYQQLLNIADKYSKTNPSSIVNIKELIADSRALVGNLSSAYKGGSAALGAEDYIASRTAYEIGEILKTNVNGYAALQKSYKPVMEAKELAYKIFNPNNGLKTKAAEGFFRRISTAKNVSTQDKALLSFLEEGVDVAGQKVPGIGQISKEMVDIGQKIKSLGLDKQATSEMIEASKTIDIYRLSSKLNRINAEEKVLTAAQNKTLNQISNKVSKLEKMLTERNKVDALKKKVAIGAVTTAVAGLGAQKLIQK